jgi:hypothetical protein
MPGHLDIRMTKHLRKLVEAAVHHVPGCKGAAQVVEPKVLNPCTDEQVRDDHDSISPSSRRIFRREESYRRDRCRGELTEVNSIYRVRYLCKAFAVTNIKQFFFSEFVRHSLASQQLINALSRLLQTTRSFRYISGL